MRDKVYWAALANIPQLGGKTVTRLLAQFGSLGAIFEADATELEAVKGVGPMTTGRIRQTDLHAVENSLIAYQAEGIRLIAWDEPAYPAPLLKTEDAPPLLFLKGEYLPVDEKGVAIIGTRKPGRESQRIAHEIAGKLVERGWTIISGLAYGIDATVHEGALAAGGRTLAVLGNGLRQIYPKKNEYLAGRVTDNGALISELPPDQTVTPQNLAARNRITSGLSRAVIIVQSEEDSGSLITCRHAYKQGRPIFAIASASNPIEVLQEMKAITLDPITFSWDTFEEVNASQTASFDCDNPLLPGFESLR